MTKWFLIQCRVCEQLTDDKHRIRKIYLPMWIRLVQAQTEAEALAKIRLELKQNQTIEKHDNLTIL